MQNEIIVNVTSGETRVAIVEKGHFAELHIERESGKSVVGNVVKGRVSRVLPGMQAAFVDIGLEKAGFLYVGDYFAEPESGADGKPLGTPKPRHRGRGGHRQPPSIETVLKEGQEIVVQLAKEPIGSKGARITSHVSIAGRHLVLTPWAPRVGVSRRIASDRERRRLRDLVAKHRPRELGFIIRTAGDGLREADLEADIRYLAATWEAVQQRKPLVSAPGVLYAEPGLPLKVLRDFANADTRRVVVDDEATYLRLRDFVDRYLADPKPRVEHYQGKQPIFDDFGLEAQVQANLERKVRLKSGGSLVIDQKEALTAIDVNSGRYVGRSDLEDTVFKTNLEAVKEVVNQLRFRNIGGIIIIDLIDMESAANRAKVYRELQEALRQDKSRTNLLKISELGLVEMTRKRTRESLVQALCEPCGYCEGRGYVLSPESVALRLLRKVKTDVPRFCGNNIAVTVNPAVAHELLGVRKDALAALSEELGTEIEVRARTGLHQEQFEVTALDSGPPVPLALRWLEEPKPEEDEAVADEIAQEVTAEVALEEAPAEPEAAAELEAATEALDAGEQSRILPPSQGTESTVSLGSDDPNPSPQSPFGPPAEPALETDPEPTEDS